MAPRDPIKKSSAFRHPSDNTGCCLDIVLDRKTDTHAEQPLFVPGETITGNVILRDARLCELFRQDPRRPVITGDPPVLKLRLVSEVSLSSVDSSTLVDVDRLWSADARRIYQIKNEFRNAHVKSGKWVTWVFWISTPRRTKLGNQYPPSVYRTGHGIADEDPQPIVEHRIEAYAGLDGLMLQGWQQINLVMPKPPSQQSSWQQIKLTHSRTFLQTPEDMLKTPKPPSPCVSSITMHGNVPQSIEAGTVTDLALQFPAHLPQYRWGLVKEPRAIIMKGCSVKIVARTRIDSPAMCGTLGQAIEMHEDVSYQRCSYTTSCLEKPRFGFIDAEVLYATIASVRIPSELIPSLNMLGVRRSYRIFFEIFLDNCGQTVAFNFDRPLTVLTYIPDKFPEAYASSFEQQSDEPPNYKEAWDVGDRATFVAAREARLQDSKGITGNEQDSTPGFDGEEPPSYNQAQSSKAAAERAALCLQRQSSFERLDECNDDTSVGRHAYRSQRFEELGPRLVAKGWPQREPGRMKSPQPEPKTPDKGKGRIWRWLRM